MFHFLIQLVRLSFVDREGTPVYSTLTIEHDDTDPEAAVRWAMGQFEDSGFCVEGVALLV